MGPKVGETWFIKYKDNEYWIEIAKINSEFVWILMVGFGTPQAGGKLSLSRVNFLYRMEDAP